jgi:hypothetical protein
MSREDGEHEGDGTGEGAIRRGRQQMANNGADPNRDVFGEGAGEVEQDVGVASGGRGRQLAFFGESIRSAVDRNEAEEEEEREDDDVAYVQPTPGGRRKVSLKPKAKTTKYLMEGEEAKPSAKFKREPPVSFKRTPFNAVSGQSNTATEAPLNISAHFDPDTQGFGVQTSASAPKAQSVAPPKAPTRALPPQSKVGRPKKSSVVVTEASKAQYRALEKERDLNGMVQWMADHNVPISKSLRTKIEAGTHTHTLLKNAVRKQHTIED